MKTSDLMIGDWVKVYRHEDPVQVVLVDVDHIITSDEEDPVYDIDFEPIPITATLLDAYFPLCDVLAWWPHDNDNGEPDGFEIECPYESYYHVIDNIHYVHELQHILRLRGFTEEANKLKP